MPFTFNEVELCFVIINEKPWTRAREVRKTPEYDAKTWKTANIIRDHCNSKASNEQYTCCMYTSQLAKGFEKIRYLHS